ncbi:MAG: hypothetical protein IVW57_11150 [Ktedonobacterales bacterium]|nr:hypothetical protein [Ktedonobacterales bacterium]
MLSDLGDLLLKRFPALEAMLTPTLPEEPTMTILKLALVDNLTPQRIAEQVHASLTTVNDTISLARSYIERQRNAPSANTLAPEGRLLYFANRNKRSNRHTGQPHEADLPDGEHQMDVSSSFSAAEDQHVENILESIISGEAYLSLEEKRRVAGHLMTCEHCQIILGSLIYRLTMRAEHDSVQREKGFALLSRLNETIRKSRTRKELSAYALKYFAKGEDTARAVFPDVAKHLATCEACRADVRTRVERLNAQFDAVGLKKLTGGASAEEAARHGPSMAAEGAEVAQAEVAQAEVAQVASPALVVALGDTAVEAMRLVCQRLITLPADDQRRLAIVMLADEEQPPKPWYEAPRTTGVWLRSHRVAVSALPLPTTRAPKEGGAAPYARQPHVSWSVLGTRNEATPRDRVSSDREPVMRTLREAFTTLDHSPTRTSAPPEVPRIYVLAHLGSRISESVLPDLITMLQQLATDRASRCDLTIMGLPPTATSGQPEDEASGDEAAGGWARASAFLAELVAPNNPVRERHPGARHEDMRRFRLGHEAITREAITREVLLVGATPASRGDTLAHAASVDLLQRLGDATGVGTLLRPHAAERERPPGIATLPARSRAASITSSCAFEVVFPARELARAFALVSAAHLLPELAARFRDQVPDAVRMSVGEARTLANQLQRAGETSAAWRGQLAEPSAYQRSLLDPPEGRAGAGDPQVAVERLYRWASQPADARPGTPIPPVTGKLDLVTPFMEALLRTLKATLPDAPPLRLDDGSLPHPLAACLVRFFERHYHERFRTAQLFELAMILSGARSLEEGAVSLRHFVCEALALSRSAFLPWLPASARAEASPPVLALAARFDTARFDTARFDTARGPRALRDTFRDAVAAVVGPEIRLEITAFSDPHRLQISYTQRDISLSPPSGRGAASRESAHWPTRTSQEHGLVDRPVYPSTGGQIERLVREAGHFEQQVDPLTRTRRNRDTPAGNGKGAVRDTFTDAPGKRGRRGRDASKPAQ